MIHPVYYVQYRRTSYDVFLHFKCIPPIYSVIVEHIQVFDLQIAIFFSISIAIYFLVSFSG